MSAPIVVIGGGLAGLIAANRAAELGLSPTVLEKGGDESYRCNSRFASGVLHVSYEDIAAAEEALHAAIARETAGFTPPEVADAVVGTAGRALAWIRENGARVIRVPMRGVQRYVLAPPRQQRPGGLHRGQGGEVLLRALAARLAERGGTLVLGAAARAIGTEEGRCAWVEAERNGAVERFPAAAVVIADGGFQGDEALVRAHISPRPDLVVQRGAGTGAGDGLRMGMALGGATAGMSRFYGHLLSRDALGSDALWPYPCLDVAAVAGIIVGRDGRRFADEGGGGVYLANMVAALDDPASATVVFDQAIWDGPARNEVLGPNPHLKTIGGTLYQADDLRTLAEKAELPPDALLASVAAHNAAVAGQPDPALDPPRSVAPRPAMPIAEPPFYAAPACAGITYTMGGLRIDADAHVLGEDGTPVPGLYAAGSAAGGVEGGPAAGYVGGLAKAFIFGLRAAETIAREQG